MRLLAYPGLALAILLTSVAGSQARAAGPPAGPNARFIQGSITALDTAASPPTVTIARGRSRSSAAETAAAQPSRVTLKVVQNTTIRVGDIPGVLADLRAGQPVSAAYDRTSLEAFVISVPAPPTERTVTGKALTANTQQVTLDTNGDGTADLTLSVDDTTQLGVGAVGLSRAQAGLLVGLPVVARYNLTSFLAVSLRARTDDLRRLRAPVTAVDAAAGTLTVQAGNGPLTLVLAAGARVRLPGRTASLQEVVVGDNVEVSYVTNGEGTNVAVEVTIVVRQRQVSGLLTAVGADSVTITPRRTGAAPVVLTVVAGTTLRLNGRRVLGLSTLANALSAAQAANRTLRAEARYIERGPKRAALDVRVTGRVPTPR